MNLTSFLFAADGHARVCSASHVENKLLVPAEICEAAQ